MDLNPMRASLSRQGRGAFHVESAFRSEAESGLAGFRAARTDIERHVRNGDLTVKAARERAGAAAAALRQRLLTRAEGFSPAPAIFVQRLIEAAESRRLAREVATLESIQRDTNQLIRRVLVEQQIVNRSREFEGGAWVRPLNGGPPAPTLDSLLQFQQQAARSGDEAAQEWSRRQLLTLRGQVTNAEDQQRIDSACDRPDQVNPALVERYIKALDNENEAALATFVAHALESRDANACCAAFVLAREATGPERAGWVRQVLEGVKGFPDAALATLREWEAEQRRVESNAARTHAEYAIEIAEAEARLANLEAPSAADLRAQDRRQSRPVAAPDQPIGLNLAFRGFSPEELAAMQPSPVEDSAD